MMKTIAMTSVALAISATTGLALAKLPPPSPEAQAAAAAAKHKTAWADKVAAYKLCLSQEKTAQHYFKTKNPQGKPSADLPACTDPGPYVAEQAASNKVGEADAKPVPAAGKQQ